MPKNTFFPHEITIFWSAKKWCKDTFFPTLHALSLVIFATATAVAFVLLHNSRFNSLLYTVWTNAFSEIAPEVMPRYSRLLVWKITLVQTSFTEPPNTIPTLIKWNTHWWPLMATMKTLQEQRMYMKPAHVSPSCYFHTTYYFTEGFFFFLILISLFRHSSTMSVSCSSIHPSYSTCMLTDIWSVPTSTW